MSTSAVLYDQHTEDHNLVNNRIQFGSIDPSVVDILLNDHSGSKSVLSFGSFSANFLDHIQSDIMPKFAGPSFWESIDVNFIPSSIGAWLDHARDLIHADYEEPEIAQAINFFGLPPKAKVLLLSKRCVS